LALLVSLLSRPLPRLCVCNYPILHLEVLAAGY
jgi:hypothetical protein